MPKPIKTLLGGFFLFLLIGCPLSLQAKEEEAAPAAMNELNEINEWSASLPQAQALSYSPETYALDTGTLIFSTSEPLSQSQEAEPNAGESPDLNALSLDNEDTSPSETDLDFDPDADQISDAVDEQDSIEPGDGQLDQEPEPDMNFDPDSDFDMDTSSGSEGETEPEPDSSVPEIDPAANYGWQQDGSYLSFIDGSRRTGFLSWNNEQYYFHEDGSKAFNETLVLNGKTYRFDEEGRLIKGFTTDPTASSYQYYSLYDGHQTDGIKAYDGDLYWLNQISPAYGLVDVDGLTYYSQGDGTLANDEFAEVNGIIGYFNSNGTQVIGEMVYIDGEPLYLSSKDGAVVSQEEFQIRQMAQEVIDTVGTDLLDLFNWEVAAMDYEKDIFTKSREEYALKAFSEHKGNCFAYAAMYYYLADQLGYEARYINSWVKFYNGNSSGHGWVMIRDGDKEYIYDPEAQDELSESGRFNFYRQDPWNPLFDYVYPDGIEPPQGCAHPYLYL